MFEIDAATKRITMHRGDTGEFVCRAVTPEGETPVTFTSASRGLFTVKSANGTEIMRRVYELSDRAFEVRFSNPDTDYLTPGDYQWDVRYVVNPPDGWDGTEITDNLTEVKTPGSPFVLHINSTVGQL